MYHYIQSIIFGFRLCRLIFSKCKITLRIVSSFVPVRSTTFKTDVINTVYINCNVYNIIVIKCIIK